MATRVSAGILAYRRRDAGRLEVLLVHPGGPFFAKKGDGYWSIPKGEPDPGETDMAEAARREFEEETGQPVPDGPLIALGTITQKGGKVVHAWAVEADLDTASMTSSTFEMDWPPFSGRKGTFPEIDGWAYFGPEEARLKIKSSQIPLLERLEEALK